MARPGLSSSRSARRARGGWQQTATRERISAVTRAALRPGAAGSACGKRSPVRLQAVEQRRKPRDGAGNDRSGETRRSERRAVTAPRAMMTSRPVCSGSGVRTGGGAARGTGREWRYRSLYLGLRRGAGGRWVAGRRDARTARGCSSAARGRLRAGGEARPALRCAASRPVPFHSAAGSDGSGCSTALCLLQTARLYGGRRLGKKKGVESNGRSERGV